MSDCDSLPVRLVLLDVSIRPKPQGIGEMDSSMQVSSLETDIDPDCQGSLVRLIIERNSDKTMDCFMDFYSHVNALLGDGLGKLLSRLFSKSYK